MLNFVTLNVTLKFVICAEKTETETENQVIYHLNVFIFAGTMASEMEQQCVQNGSSTTVNGSGDAPEVKKLKVTETSNNTHNSHQRSVTEMDFSG